MENADIFANTDSYLVQDFMNEIHHGTQVSRLAGMLAKEIKLDNDTCHEVEIAGMLHDIGKLRISNYIYGRDEGAMQIEEMRYLRMHAQLGYEIAKTQGYSKGICEMILYHHENYDGSGYPFNLRGEEIPIGARVLRVCDVFVALISDRPYRKAFDIEKATELLIDEVRHFDMKLFLAFQSIIHTEKLLEEIKQEEYRED